MLIEILLGTQNHYDVVKHNENIRIYTRISEEKKTFTKQKFKSAYYSGLFFVFEFIVSVRLDGGPRIESCRLSAP